ncbi:hypothetical protein [Aeromicrobium sp. UC242_57]|uniref:hypothetical protein n=1 Tax=Aeromicrobium sp. UC242_57 TaxID=3374624 RepID=UPI0037B92DED
MSASCSTEPARRDLAGTTVNTRVDVEGATADYSCRFGTEPNLARGPLVQVQSLPAERWASEVPKLIDQLRSSGNPLATTQKDKLDAALRLVGDGTDVDPAIACDIFVNVAAANGATDDASRVVSVVEVSPGVSAVSAQTCTDQRVTSVVLSGPDVAGSPAEQDAALTALDLAHEAAVQGTSDVD